MNASRNDRQLFDRILSDYTIIRHPDCVFSAVEADSRAHESLNSITKIKKDTMETQRNPNEPIKPTATGQEGGQQSGGSQERDRNKERGRDKQGGGSQEREREKQGGGSQQEGGSQEPGQEGGRR
jgi:hypothetical protein